MKSCLQSFFLPIALVVLGCTTLFSQETSAYWSTVQEAAIAVKGDRQVIPGAYRTIQLNVPQLQQVLNAAPMQYTAEARNAPAVLQLPTPDGGWQHFRIVESPVMERGLADQFPEIKTYAGQCVEHPETTIRLDFTPKGFHAMVYASGATYFIDPYSSGTTTEYIVYYKKDFVAGSKVFSCSFDEAYADLLDNSPHSPDAPIVTGADNAANKFTSLYGDCNFRTYRLALSCTGEYAAFHGGTVALALAAEVTTMNRVNGVFETDLNVHLNIIANNNLITYINAATDPFTNGDPGSMINENQVNTDAVIGSANYDIGHIFGTNSGGLAGLGVVCSGGNKAKGVTGSGAPVGDPFDIDYVAHEMGHQFSGNHTQNNSCNRNNATAFEPGSGYSVMGYAGICAPNVQPNSDAHFHAGNLNEMYAFITGAGNTCAVQPAYGNNAPVLNSWSGTQVIPKGTPFVLSASASDADGNTLTYSWDQMDTQVSTQPPVGTSTGGPNFRGFNSTTNPTRYFPNITDLVNNVSPVWEVLPTVGRTLNFRVVVRDNNAGGGCNDHENIVLTVDGTSGPLAVTYPTGAGLTLACGTTQAISWNVANTTAAPVSCPTVDILLSTDGGFTYPTILAAAVANNGSANVVMPDIATTTARIMVRGTGRAFFDISNNNFTITACASGCTPPTVNAPTVTQPTCAVLSGTIVVNATGAGALEYSVNNGANWQPGANFPGLAPGNYNIVVRLQAMPTCTTAYVGNPVVINAPVLPTVFTVTGGGAFCSGGAGVPVGLSGSQTGVNYQLRLNAVNTGAPVPGSGAAISFGNQTGAGTYTVLATNVTTTCTATMSGSVVVSVNPPPTAFTVTGGGSICTTDITGAPVGLSGSQTGVNYQLRLNAVNTGAPVAGTGAAITFGPQMTVGTYTVVATLVAGGCSATMTGSVSVGIFNCTVSISDPCVCKNNATTLTNGQFDETIKVNAPGNQVWTVVIAPGLYAANSPAPPSAPTPITNGTLLTNLGVAMNMFELKGIHVDALGYSVTVTNNAGTILTIGNSCSYPNPSIDADLSGTYCLFSDPVDLVGTPGDNNIASQGFTVNGVPATQFNPAQGVGNYVIEYTVNGGVPKAFGPNDPGCIQKVSTIVHVVQTPGVLNCNDVIYVSLDGDCEGEVLPDDVLEGTYGCFDDYLVELDKTLPFGNGPWVPATLTSSDIGHTYQTRITHLVSGNKCWGTVVIEDKIAPELACEDIHLICPINTYDPNYLVNVLGIAEGNPSVSDCSNYALNYVDTWFDLPCNGIINGQEDVSAYVQRKWTATDQWGNSTTCLQYLYFDRLHVYDVLFPEEYAISCDDNINTDPSVTGAPYVVAFGREWPLYPGAGFCEMQSAYTDQILPVCDGTYKILRTWTVLDWCIPTSPFPPFTNPLYYIQLIKVVDETGPVFTCPANLSVSVDPFQCCATVNLPDRIIEDACSRVNNISGMVVTFDPYTGAQTGMVTFGGDVTDFPGNNWWDRDTLGQWGWTPCLPIGSHTVTYRAQDDCSNVSTCTFKLTVADYIPPVAACDQTTVVGIGYDDPNDCYKPADGCDGAGVTWDKAINFDDGSYDECSNLKFTIRRMQPYSDCINNLDHDPCYPNGDSEFTIATAESDSIKFYCCEVGTTQTVILRVYQIDVNGNMINGPDGSPVYNECMIQVEVQDKVKPLCQSPANVTVTCEQFDPSLWLYGKASVLDNCCLDTTKVYQGQCGLTHTVNYAQFDTLCNKGTITRTFRAFDCHGQSSQCTQRVVVTYEQDYYVRFPNDVIVTVCDGTGNYGEPTFFGEDCELLGVSYEDQIFTVVPDACFKIERNWKIINWCTYNPNLVPLCIDVPNPNPNAITNHPTNLPGPIVSPIQTVGDPWKSTIVKINPSDALATNYSIYYDPNANCYTYKQIIKIIDTQDPVVQCPASPVTICDVTANDPQLWNEMYWWDNANQSHDLCEAPSDICITATDACSGSNINIEYQLFLDLDGDGTMETVVNSTQLGSQIGGLGWNNILYGNFTGAGTSRQFDGRPVPQNQKWGFAIQETVSGVNKTACVKFNTFQAQNTYVTPQLPHGTHKIKWFVSDGCGNETICEYTIVIKDCKAPTVVCLNGLSVNIMPTGMIVLWGTDFLQYAEDNCTLNPFLKYGIRKCGQGTGFPVDAQGNPITNVQFDCSELGTQCVELWSIDLAGNADYCETYIIVQDNAGNCPNNDQIVISGAIKTEVPQGVEEVTVNLTGTPMDFSPPFSFNINATDNNGVYQIGNVPLAVSMSITPAKDDNPLNGVTTYDLVLMSKHILGLEPLGSPYKMIAADANKSNSITTFDIVELRKLILGIYQELPNNTSWRFVEKAQSFSNPANPFMDVIHEQISLANALTNLSNNDFVGVKIGDVNNTAVANSLMTAEDRTVGTLLFDVNDRDVTAGEEFEVSFKAADKTQGYQMTLNLNGLAVSEIVGGDKVTANNFGVFANALTVSVDGADAFTVKFRAARSGKLSEMMKLSSEITTAEAYSVADGRLDVALRFGSPAGMTISGVGFELYQNQPNPFVNKTFVGFHLPEAAAATLTVYDETGRAVFTQKGDFAKGYNAISLDRALLNTTGVLYYTLETATDSATRKMIQSK